ncbi:hypothetical protein EV424DRAFT_1341458 [Suillus variegatus]|nr:hypothetical protein EV424DRAFT_1341458 [Suillus variegatus]
MTKFSDIFALEVGDVHRSAGVSSTQLPPVPIDSVQTVEELHSNTWGTSQPEPSNLWPQTSLKMFCSGLKKTERLDFLLSRPDYERPGSALASKECATPQHRRPLLKIS